MINVTILKKKGCFVIAFEARTLQSCNTTACDITGLVCSIGQWSNISISLLFEHTLVLKWRKTVAIAYALELIRRAVILLQVEEVMNLVILCAFAREDVKEHSIWYSSTVRAAAFCVRVHRNDLSQCVSTTLKSLLCCLALEWLKTL